ncbi:MAG: class I SAM-dependent methyltransferase [Deferribacteres bacterium]|nr:class I SAM-dependent methyltransferase [candidate division KSB1 bacterium]MCB9502066.1 class I SAM-dependent methyltransferase [Deferribacteres bacterium]
MKLYDKHILPYLTHKICSLSPATKQRQKIVPFAEGKILEIGIGSGLNLPHYDRDKVAHIWGLDPSIEMWARSEITNGELPFPFEFLSASAEQIPLGTNSVDSIVITYTLCSIPNVHAALLEMRRVLKPGGKLFFSEHGTAPETHIRTLQNVLNPIWNIFSGGCQLNRNIPELLKESGFSFEKLDSMYIPGWKFASYNYWGVAK